MVKPSTIFMMFICLVSGIFIGIGVKTVSLKRDEKTEKRYIEQPQSKKVMVITFDDAQQDKFFTQIRAFADKWNYAIRIASAGPNIGVYSIEMWREDIKIIAINNYGAGRFSMAFYETYPDHPVPDQYFEEEVSDLEKFISEIPGATLSVEK